MFFFLITNAGYGAKFKNWMLSERPEPYNSYGNGAAMRVSPVGWYVNEPELWIYESTLTVNPDNP
ncbi:MAG: hypothetical protein LBT05_07155 [Planctomycetaceae bacterium]|nr:hypothetical protein [Planctomycetaceae bacterium]